MSLLFFSFLFLACAHIELSEELVEEVERVFFLFLLLAFLSSESDPPVVFFHDSARNPLEHFERGGLVL